MSRFTQRLARGRVAPIAAFPVRAAAVVRHDAQVLRWSRCWLVRSREHSHYTHDLTPLNIEPWRGG
jgi:hypothetical protein